MRINKIYHSISLEKSIEFAYAHQLNICRFCKYYWNQAIYYWCSHTKKRAVAYYLFTSKIIPIMPITIAHFCRKLSNFVFLLNVSNYSLVSMTSLMSRWFLCSFFFMHASQFRYIKHCHRIFDVFVGRQKLLSPRKWLHFFKTFKVKKV